MAFKKLVSAIPEIQSIWFYDKDGRAIVTSVAQPPPTQNYADRDFFRAHDKPNDTTYYGQVYTSQFNGQPFFTVSRGLTRDEVLFGVAEASVLPSNFMRFYSTMAYSAGLQYALLRNDGTFLVRFPAVPPGGNDRLDEHTGFHRTITQHPDGGFYKIDISDRSH